MNYTFKKVILHNFLSHGHSEIDLQNRNYCKVVGVNKCPLDKAFSNGAGKSSWISAICWALTGECVQEGIKNVKNRNVDENLCFVTLVFSADGSEYEITRYKEPSSNLKVVINGEDKSGKGIRESELVLSSYLPDLTKDLIGNIILIGQGMPNRFTNNTPAGRKEVLEKLSKSDFMIEDIKNRITQRSVVLNNNMRTLDDSILAKKSKVELFERMIISKTDTYNQLYVNQPVPDFNSRLDAIKLSTDELTVKIKELKEANDSQTEKLKEIRGRLDDFMKVRLDSTSKEQERYNSAIKDVNDKKIEITSKINSTENEIRRIESIRDVCPTCHRPLEGVVKPDVTPLKEQLTALRAESDKIKLDSDTLLTEHNNIVKVINDKYTADSSEAKSEETQYTQSISFRSADITKYVSEQTELQREADRLVIQRDNYFKDKEKMEKEISDMTKEKEELSKLLSEESQKKVDLQEHINDNSKMMTLAKRDFRGVLLGNVIAYIDAKAKEYCKEAFGTSELDFVLNGNNIDITYCGKDFEGLSGGEQQKINIILQFAIRDMMSHFLNFRSNIIALDEIFDNLDAVGVSSILTIISTKLCDIESIFIISHHQDLDIPYDSELTIEKSVEGISRVV